MRTVQSRLTRVICLVYFFLLTFKFDDGPASHDIDPSWSAVASWAWNSGQQWGRDIVFSYGPYAFLSPRFSFDLTIFYTAALAQVLYGVLIVFLAAATLKTSQRFMTGMLFATIVAYGVWVAGDSLWLMSYALSLLALLNGADEKRSRQNVTAVVAGLVAAIPWLVKFTSFPLALVWVGCLAIAPVCARVRTIALISFVITASALWAGSGGSFSSLIQFVESSFEIALGYGSAMQKPSAFWVADALGLTLLLATLSTTLAFLVDRRVIDLKRVVWAIMLTSTALISFKATFTRIDEDHIMIFFPVACAISALSIAFESEVSKFRRGSTVAVFALSLLAAVSTPEISNLQKIGFTGLASLSRVMENSKKLVLMKDVFEQNDLERQSISRMYDFPVTRREVADETVDIFPVSQGIIFLNNLNFHPRPVFQSYAAFTKSLTERNAAFLRTPDAPRWMMLRWAAIDGRLPSSEDPASLREIFTRYELKFAERDFLIFRRKSDPSSVAGSSATSRAYSRGRMRELIALPKHAGPLSMRFSLHPTLAGRLATLVLREPRFYMRVLTRDGKEKTFRLARGSTSAGFLISPLLLTNHDVESWLVDGTGNQVSAIEFVPETVFGIPAFEPAVEIEWTSDYENVRSTQFG